MFRSKFSNFLLGKYARNYENFDDSKFTLPKTEWSGQTCSPLTVEEFLEPQLHPDRNYQKIVEQGRSFADLLAPRLDTKEGHITLQDLTSVGRMFNVRTCSTEARTAEAIQSTFARAMHAVSQVFPQYEENPWIVQWFVQDESDYVFQQSLEAIQKYAKDSSVDSSYSSHWFQTLKNHYRDISRPNGLFTDPHRGGERWRGKERRTRICIWRTVNPKNASNEESIDHVCDQLINAFAQGGIELIPSAAKELYEWLTTWFVPIPEEHTGCSNAIELLNKFPWNSSDSDRALSMLSDFGRSDIGRSALHGTAPWTWKKPGVWWFRGCPSRFITLDELSAEPEIGHLTAERSFGNSTSTLFDKLPEGSIWSMTIVYCSQNDIKDKILQVRKNSVGDDPAAVHRRDLANIAVGEISRGNPIFRVFSGVYVFGRDLKELDHKSEAVLSLMSAHSLRPITPRYDPIALDSYVRGLPFGFDPIQDSKPYARRAKLWFSSHIAKVAPVYGRSKGTGYPGCILFNRGAELLMFDPLNHNDRSKNAHSLILGPTGSGKTAFLIYLLMHSIAIHRPRVILITALPTFGLLCDHCERHDLTIHRVRIDGKSKVALPPFKFAQLLLNPSPSETVLNAESIDEQDLSAQIRDPLGEMEIQARLMITGGEKSEEENLRRDDLDLIRTSLIEAAKKSRSENRTQTMTQDIVDVLRDVAKTNRLGEQVLSKEQVQRSARIAGALHLFCTGLNGDLFNTEGDIWPEADITLVELDLLARKGYEDRLAVALTGLFSMINNKIELDQYRERQTIVVIDEAHLLLQNPLVSPYINRISAMWRTFGSWLWISTQNIRQFPEQAKELLNQPEWWYCLSVDKDEIDQISRFRSLTSEQQSLLLAAKKSPGLYTEGTVLSTKVLSLFRNVPPALALALAQTEKSERAERARIMKLKQCSELDAAYEIARQIRANRLAAGS